MMIKQLTRSGNSLALVLDKALLELIRIDVDAPVVELSADGAKLVIRAADAAQVAALRAKRRKVRDAYAKVKRRSAKTLRKLAE